MITERSMIVLYSYYTTTVFSSSSSSDRTTTVAEVKASPLSFSFARITHCVVRPVVRTLASGTRTVCPDFEIKITLLVFFSSSVRVNAPMIAPVFSVVAPTLIHEPHLHCSR